MIPVKLKTSEARLLQALRAGPMDSIQLSDRFPSGAPVAGMIKRGFIEANGHRDKITESGRNACPSRRQVEMAKDLPPAPIQVKHKAIPVQTISINAVPMIKPVERDNEMKLLNQPSKSQFIREIITSNHGINHDELIAKFTNNSTDHAEIKKASDLIEYVMRQSKGQFTRCNDPQHPVDNKNYSKRYYAIEDYLKRAETIQKEIENTVPTLAQHHEAKIYGTDSIKSDSAEVPTLINTPAAEKTKSALDVQEGGDHYKRMKIQPVEYIMANNLGFAEGSIVKYVSRWKNKNGIEDLKKARHFLDILIEQKTA